ncbi:hypothetical protein ASPSYDRAFT_68105 [Aspergillus sydowii CBS 593.65]|uniref:Profilin n=1 Tax=Aspergillus sydowii CBS 593.65 TaxID=1036612 RepID=A0A1L9TL10_9EURO|nr:uncharacterized protein ASPSYDRAFT_68105 [Aspergillus sydowii CBS 593.65]OJJ60071.1 hypothetical protein ASPSYDRAFT_68105 [Aspergillus sydowii CBS 593.65]
MDADAIPAAVSTLVSSGFVRAAVYSLRGGDFAGLGGNWKAHPADIQSLIDGFSDPDNAAARGFTINGSRYTLEVRDETFFYCPSDADTILFAHKNGDSIVLGESIAGALSLKDAEVNVKEVALCFETVMRKRSGEATSFESESRELISHLEEKAEVSVVFLSHWPQGACTVPQSPAGIIGLENQFWTSGHDVHDVHDTSHSSPICPDYS